MPVVLPIEPWPEPATEDALTRTAAATVAETIRADAGPQISKHELQEFTGPLDLRKANASKHLVFDRCRFLEQLVLRDASLASVEFKSCHFVGGIDASGLQAANRLLMTQCWSGRKVDLSGAHVAVLELTGSTFQRSTTTPLPDADPALDLSIMTIDRSVSAAGLRIFGLMKLVGCKIGGECNISDLTIRADPAGIGLGLREITVGRSLTAVDLAVSGQVKAPGAQIGGELNLRGANIVVGGGGDTNQDRALDLLSATTDRWLNLSGAVICGQVRLSAANIGGKVQLLGTTLTTPAGHPPMPRHWSSPGRQSRGTSS